jgi:hypothetical protein
MILYMPLFSHCTNTVACPRHPLQCYSCGCHPCRQNPLLENFGGRSDAGLGGRRLGACGSSSGWTMKIVRSSATPHRGQQLRDRLSCPRSVLYFNYERRKHAAAGIPYSTRPAVRRSSAAAPGLSPDGRHAATSPPWPVHRQIP